MKTILTSLLALSILTLSTHHLLAATQDSLKQKPSSPLNPKTPPPFSNNKNIDKFLTIGQINGKLINPSSQESIKNASVQLFIFEWDSISKKPKEKLFKNTITSKNGEFSFEDLPVTKPLNIQFVALGFQTQKQPVNFNFNPKDLQNSGGDMIKLMASFSKNLGTISLNPNAQQNKDTLAEIFISSRRNSEIGKQIFNVDKNTVTTGSTAQELLKTIPMLNVDIEGNVSLRGGSPQIYVDGKPSALTLDQIPSDLIDRVEVIANPSAKYDAESSGGIVNIILKRSSKLGINATLMGGTMLYMQPYKQFSLSDLAQYNGGIILNIRKNKINTFFNLFSFQRKMESQGEVDRSFSIPTTNPNNFIQNLKQENLSLNSANMTIFRSGIDYFLNNTNTISFDINYMKGNFVPYNDIVQTSLFSNNTTSFSSRESDSKNKMQNIKSTISYKKNFDKEGKELTASFYAEYRDIDFKTLLTNQHYSQYADISSKQFNTQVFSQTLVQSASEKYRFQSDFSNPLNDSSKIETGINFTYSNTPFTNQYDSLSNQSVNIKNFSKTRYEYSDLNLAAYLTYSKTLQHFSYQIGARIEKFFYNGTLYNADNTPTKYAFTLPLNIFPSIFITKPLNDQSQFQASYSLRINRPSIFNLIPLIDYSDSSNLRQGNPALTPELIHIAEINYQYNTKKTYFLASIYYKQTNDVISQFLKVDSSNPSHKLLINTFINSQHAINYGSEIIFKNTFFKDAIELNTNFNIYNTLLQGNAYNINAQKWSFYAKETINIKLPKGFSFQFFIDYQHEALTPPSSGNRTSGNQQPGGPPNMLPPSSTSQGYIKPNFGTDIALKKEFIKGLFSLTITGNDIFQTRKYNAFSQSAAFQQNQWSTRNQSLFYINFSARIGKMDATLMKKKNLKAEKEQAQDANNQGGL